MILFTSLMQNGGWSVNAALCSSEQPPSVSGVKVTMWTPPPPTLPEQCKSNLVCFGYFIVLKVGGWTLWNWNLPHARSLLRAGPEPAAAAIFMPNWVAGLADQKQCAENATGATHHKRDLSPPAVEAAWSECCSLTVRCARCETGCRATHLLSSFTISNMQND